MFYIYISLKMFYFPYQYRIHMVYCNVGWMIFTVKTQINITSELMISIKSETVIQIQSSHTWTFIHTSLHAVLFNNNWSCLVKTWLLSRFITELYLKMTFFHISSEYKQLFICLSILSIREHRYVFLGMLWK